MVNVITRNLPPDDLDKAALLEAVTILGGSRKILRLASDVLKPVDDMEYHFDWIHFCIHDSSDKLTRLQEDGWLSTGVHVLEDESILWLKRWKRPQTSAAAAAAAAGAMSTEDDNGNANEHH